MSLEPESALLGQGPNKKRQWCDANEDISMGSTSTYSEKVQHGHISEQEKAYLLCAMSEDFSRLEGKSKEGKRVLQVPTKLSCGRALAGLHRAMACGLYLYFMGKPPSEDEFRRWFTELYGDRVVLQKFHFAGKGFYQALVESEQQRECVLATVAAFKGNVVFTVPWSPALQPEEMLLHQCPVWIELPSLPYYLWDQVKDIASALGKVLYIPSENQQESKATKRACILWDRRQPTPDVLEFDVEGYKLCVEIKFQTFPDCCYKCKLQGHFARDCPGPQTCDPNPKKAETSEEKKTPEPAAPSNSKEIVLRDTGKAPEATHKDNDLHPKSSKEEGWKTVQGKKIQNKQGSAAQGKPLQDHNKQKPRSNIKKDARNKPKPLATMLEDKENWFPTVDLSDE